MSIGNLREICSRFSTENERIISEIGERNKNLKLEICDLKLKIDCSKRREIKIWKREDVIRLDGM